MAGRRGFKYYKKDTAHSSTPGVLDIEVNGSKAGGFVGGTIATGYPSADAGRFIEYLTVVDDDTQHMTLAAADILAGVNVHTSTVGGGTITTDTAANIIAGIPLSADGQSIVSYFVNDGAQTDTFAGGTDVTIADTGQTPLINEGCMLVWMRTAATTVTVFMLGAKQA